MSQKSKHRRLRNLFKRNSRCYWCGCRVRIFNDKGERDKSKIGATLDHVVSRLDKNWTFGMRNKQVLSCRGCNQKREQEASRKLDPFELWARSGSYPRWM